MAAGASVLMPYLSFSSSMASQQARAALLVFEGVEEVQRVQAVGNQTVELHADEVGLVVLRAGGPAAHSRRSAAISVWIVLALAET